MTDTVVWLKNHARTSAGSRAAISVNSSAVRPFDAASSVARTTDHHSDGMLLRLSHLRTAQGPAPTSTAMASREGHKSMIARNEFKSAMTGTMGLSVPKIKAIVSHDYKSGLGHNVPMEQDDETIAESAWRLAFTERLREIQGKRSQEDMAYLLGISRDSWNKMVNRGSAVPTRLLPKLSKIGAVTLEWLVEGPREAVRKPAKAISPPRSRKRG